MYVNYKKIVSADFEQGFFGVEEFYFLSVSPVLPSTQFHHLKIHPVKKSEVLGFHPWQQKRDQFRNTGNLLVDMALQDPTASLGTMPWPKRTRYLGLHYGADTPFESCTNELYAVGRRAVYA